MQGGRLEQPATTARQVPSWRSSSSSVIHIVHNFIRQRSRSAHGAAQGRRRRPERGGEDHGACRCTERSLAIAALLSLATVAAAHLTRSQIANFLSEQTDRLGGQERYQPTIGVRWGDPFAASSYPHACEDYCPLMRSATSRTPGSWSSSEARPMSRSGTSPATKCA